MGRKRKRTTNSKVDGLNYNSDSPFSKTSFISKLGINLTANMLPFRA